MKYIYKYINTHFETLRFLIRIFYTYYDNTLIATDTATFILLDYNVIQIEY